MYTDVCKLSDLLAVGQQFCSAYCCFMCCQEADSEIHAMLPASRKMFLYWNTMKLLGQSCVHHRNKLITFIIFRREDKMWCLLADKHRGNIPLPISSLTATTMLSISTQVSSDDKKEHVWLCVYEFRCNIHTAVIKLYAHTPGTPCWEPGHI